LIFLVLYLICSFALPDPDWGSSPASEEGSSIGSSSTGNSSTGNSSLSLKTFYFSAAHRRWFFGAFVALLILTLVVSNSLRALSTEMTLNLVDRAKASVSSLLVAGLLFGLIVSKRWWPRSVVAVLVFVAVVFSLATQIPLG
jgi:hypothetical protein